MAEHRMEHHKEHRRARGGSTEGEGKPMDRAEDKETEKEADERTYGGHKRGGHVKKRAHGGKVHHGKTPMHVDGKAPAHHRMDRPGRKRGGGVGADTSPMTTAAKLTAPKGEHDQKTEDKRDD